jgi:uncharacterized protein YoxC
MEVIEIFIIPLIIAVIVLIVYIIKFLKSTTESIKTMVGSVSAIEQNISELKTEIVESTRNIEHITRNIAELTDKIEVDYSTLSNLIDKVRKFSIFPSKSNERDNSDYKSEFAHSEKINGLLASLNAIKTGFTVFYNKMK